MPRALRILLVDSHADAADSTALLLRLAGHEVRVARTGRHALDLARTFRPEVVVLDVVLSGDVSGLELARRLRGRAVVVALTGMGAEAYRRRAGEAGVVHYLLKPAAPDRLLGLLRALHAGGEPFMSSLQTVNDALAVRYTARGLGGADGETLGDGLLSLPGGIGPRRVELDFGGVRFLTAAGLGKLVALHRRLRDLGGRLTLCNVSGPVEEVLQLTRLTELLHIHR